MGQIRSDMKKITEEEKIDLLKRVVMIFNRYNVEYWLVFGTLLGCVRDNGFIRWDSDIDLAVSDINDVIKLKEIFKTIDIEIEEKTPKGHYRTINLIDKKLGEETSMHVDVFEFKRFHGHLSYKWTINKNIISRVSDTIHHLCCRDHVTKMGVITIDQMKMLYNFVNFIPGKIKRVLGLLASEINFLSTCKRVMVFPERYPLLKKITFYKMKVNIPITYETHLVLNYGENWLIPDPNFHGETQKVLGVIDGYEVIAPSLEMLKGEENAEIY